PPSVAAIAGFEEVLRRHVKFSRIVRRDLDWGVPIEPDRIELRRSIDHVDSAAPPSAETAGLGCRRCGAFLTALDRAATARIRPDALLSPVAQVMTRHRAILRFAVHNGPIR